MRLNSPSSSLLQASTELCTCVKISGSQAGGVPQLLAPFGDFGMPDDICGVIIAAFTGKNCSQPVSCFSSPLQRRRLPAFCCALEKVLSHHGAPTAKRPAGAAELAFVAYAAEHQHYRALLRGSPTPNPAHGRLWTGSVIPSSQRFNLDWKNRTWKLFTQAA
jgi:hypothetical protein